MTSDRTRAVRLTAYERRVLRWALAVAPWRFWKPWHERGTGTLVAKLTDREVG